jgi:SAM-dependent methyltransferase
VLGYPRGVNLTYWDRAYSNGTAVRRWPNEELVRFFGRRYFHLIERSKVKVLEVGCGAGGNLRMIALEGFDAHGIDSSAEAVDRCKYGLVRRANMTLLPYNDGSMDCVCDVFSSYCLNQSDFRIFLQEVARVLKPGGRFFSYAPSRGDERHAFPGNDYPWRFITPGEYTAELERRGLSVPYCETATRTYNGRPFEFVVIEGLSPHQ